MSDTSARPDGETLESSNITLPFDPLRVIDAIWAKKWLALVIGTAFAVVGALLAAKKLETYYTASAQLIKVTPQNTIRQSEEGEPYKPHEVSIPNLIALMYSAPLIHNAANRTDSEVSAAKLRSGLIIKQERHTDVLWVSVKTNVDHDSTHKALQGYIDEVLEYSRKIQQHDASKMGQLLQRQLETTDREIAKLNEDLLDFSVRNQIVDPDKQTDALLGSLANHNLKFQELKLNFETVDLKIAAIEKELAKVRPASSKLDAARDRLSGLRIRYTDEHPDVIEAMAVVESLEQAIAASSPNVDKPPPSGNAVAESLYLDKVRLISEKQVLEEKLGRLANVEKDLSASLELLPRKSLELEKIRDRKRAALASREILIARLREAEVVEESAEGHLKLLSIGGPGDVVVESPDRKIAIAGVLGFGGGAGMTFAFAAALVLLSQTIGSSGDLKRVTNLSVWGQISNCESNDSLYSASWAFSTWTTLAPNLASPESGSATICGIINDRYSPIPSQLALSAVRRGSSAILISRYCAGPDFEIGEALTNPESVLERVDTKPENYVEIKIRDSWQWDKPQRDYFAAALQHWGKPGHIAVFVELDQPDDPGTLLLSESLPNLLWIAKGGEPVTKLTYRINLYKAAGCKITGAILDLAPPFKLKVLNRFMKFPKLAIVALSLFLCQFATAGELPQPLGAGDIVNIRFLGQPELSRDGITISPDGTITYLQAQSVQAEGLTIDQLRQQLNHQLSRYYRKTRIVVTPNFFRSRKVYLLGKIIRKGVVVLDRPMKVLDVVTEAGGLETGLFQQNTVELADLGRSFLSRDGRHVPVDFEALFFRGDMAQNIDVIPGDYFYFPSANSNEIHVFGNVNMQGTQGLLAHTSVHSAIAQAGGFTKRAFKKRVLVVRGSLTDPECFVVDMQATLMGRATGFRLEPKDIVYIADHPWSRAEELAGIALDAFTQGAVSAWSNRNIGPLIQNPILPQIR